ncbi:hypothetical protein MBLNU457_4613t1 [Dothideomycetes sp. NU457]
MPAIREKYQRYRAVAPYPVKPPVKDGIVGWGTSRFVRKDRNWEQLKVLAETSITDHNSSKIEIRPGQWVVVHFEKTEDGDNAEDEGDTPDGFAYVCGIRQHGNDVLLCVSLGINLARADAQGRQPPQLATKKRLLADDLVTSTQLRILSVSHVQDVVMEQESRGGIVRDILDIVKDADGDDTDVSLCSTLVWDNDQNDILNGRLKVETPQSVQVERLLAAATRSPRTRKTVESTAEPLSDATSKRTANAPKTSTKKSTGKTAANDSSGRVTRQTKKSTAKTAAKGTSVGVKKSTRNTRNKSRPWKSGRQLREEAAERSRKALARDKAKKA